MSHPADDLPRQAGRADEPTAPGLAYASAPRAPAAFAADPRVGEALHRLLVASVRDYAIFAVTPDGRVATWDPGAERLKGYAAAEIVGRHISAFYPPETRDARGISARAVALLAEAEAAGRAEDEGWRVRRDGARFWADVIITPVRDAAGTLLGFAKVTRDLTARRAAEAHARELAAEQAARAAAERAGGEARRLAEALQQSNARLEAMAVEAGRAREAAEELQARYQRLFEASPLPSWTVALETGRVLDVNEAAVRRYGYARDEFLALTVADLRDPASRADLPGDLEAYRVDGRVDGAVRHRTRSGERVDMELSVRHLEYDGRPAAVVVLTDVTERRRAEARQRFLGEATALLGESLDYDATLARLVRLAVPMLADWAAYNVLDGDRVRTVAIHHPDPAMERLAREIDERYPMRADAGAGVAKVIATGEAELIEDLPDEVLRAVAHDETHLAQLRSIGFRSLINVPLVARGRVLGALGFATGRSGRCFTAEDLAFAEELGRRAGLALDNALYVRAEQDARARAEQGVERMARLARLAAAVSGAVDLREVSRLVVREARAALGADAVYVMRRAAEPGVLELLHGDGFPAGVRDAYARIPLDAPVPGAEVVRTGQPLWLATPADREGRFGHLGPTPISQAFRASATVPLQVRGATIGALGAYFAREQPFGAEDRTFLGALAEQVALALERVRLFDAERRTRALAERLQAVTAALSEALTPDQVTDIVVGQGLAALGAGAGFVATLDAAGEALEIARVVGYAEADVAPFRRMPLAQPIAVADAARTRQPVWLSSRAEAAARYPAFADPATDAGRRSWAALPLAAHGATLGALGLSFDAERVIPADERAFMLTLATQCAQALERARLYEAEERARAAAAAAGQRAEFLAEASRQLAASLDYHATLDGVARAAVPLLGDWCAVDVRVDGDGAADAWPPRVRRLAVMHQDPAKLEWARELERRQPPDWAAPTGLPRVLREGVTEFYPVLDDAMLVASARSPEELALVREIGFTAYLCVPLRARGRVVGAITLCMTESGRHYDAADRLLAEELAHRAGLAVEHAELYREAQQANAAKTQFLAVMSHELRTPLNAIGGYAELLALGIRGPVTAAQGEDLDRIRRSQQHLLTLINDVLDFARIEAGQARFRIADVRLGEVLDGVLPLVAPQAGAKRQTLDVGGCDPRLVARADGEKVRQVLLNLLSNAIKFTGAGGRIALRCAPRGAQVALAVHDTGMGIPADRLGSIFEPFVQVQSGLTRTAEGTGLGLAISRDLARGMGGDLTVESTPDVGSTFTLTLPAGAAG